MDGTYAVGTGKAKYFPETVTETADDAMRMACEMSAYWYQKQVDKCYLNWIKVYPEGDQWEWGDKLS